MKVSKRKLAEFEYREGSSTGVLFDRLKRGKAITKAKLFKGIDNPGFAFRRLQRHGKARRAFKIEVKDDKVRLVA